MAVTPSPEWRKRFADWDGGHSRQEPIRPRCKECGHRIRGANHDNGDEHKSKAK